VNTVDIPNWLLVATVGAVILTLLIVGAIVIAVTLTLRDRRNQR
jgi:hypothetical protein